MLVAEENPEHITPEILEQMKQYALLTVCIEHFIQRSNLVHFMMKAFEFERAERVLDRLDKYYQRFMDVEMIEKAIINVIRKLKIDVKEEKEKHEQSNASW